MAGAYGYEQAMMIMQKLELDREDVEQLFRRMVFNIVARNQDDHVKNIALLMDRKGKWALSPAFDMIWSYNPSGDWTAAHQMTMNGKRDGFAMDDVEACGMVARLKRSEAKTVLREVQAVVSRWRDYADAAGVHPELRDKIQQTLRLETFA